MHLQGVAEELLEKSRLEGEDPKTFKKKKWLLSLINADLGDRPVAEIKPPELLEVLRKIERRGRHDTARRARSLVVEFLNSRSPPAELNAIRHRIWLEP